MICLSYREVPLSEGAYPKKMKERPSAEWTYGLNHKYTEWDKLHYVVNSDYRVYSAGNYEGGHRAKKNYKSGQNIIILDVDNDGKEEYLSLKDAYELFKKYKCLITTTKSHQKGKDGLPPEDRYRVIIKLSKNITCTADEYAKTMASIHDTFFKFADKKCKDAARFYFGYADAEYKYFDGEEFDFELMHKRMKATEEARQTIKKATIKKAYDGEDVISKFNDNTNIETLLSNYGYIKKGNRFVSPHSSSGMAGVVLLDGEDGKQRAYSHHNSDGWEDAAIDAFGLYAIIEHSGNLSSAVKGLKNF